ncbi:MAG TPA: aldehyde dehydrogenase [Candidatus Eisenbergiella merdipullorum]|uniref:Aldehyde dehydrogenase n=1 Tax=Candidatus Eisenbergiella merdipullorum TaxID=2838553 RepID=A0A9D2I797_9FIRM|nr:aldehyde dehydrogenase [Candidatus Eisenbergiella merdipullorum]
MEKRIDALVKRQRAYFTKGRTKDVNFRLAALRRLRDGIRRREKQIAAALYADLHKSSYESYMTEIGITLDEIDFLLKHTKKYAKTKRVPASLSQVPARCTIRKDPYGVTLIMAPWNYPFLLSLEPAAGAIAAGNCCIIKPSAYAPAVSCVIKELIEELFSPGYVAVVEGGREENTLLLEQKWDYIFFTGSVSVGKLVMKKAAEHLTPVTLELGGKSPCIVEKDADLNLAAKRIVFGKFLNSGQTCVAPDYCLVQEDVRERFLALLVKWIRRFWGENPLDHKDYPRMVNEKHYSRVMCLIRGENVVTGGRGRKATLQIAPTVLRDVSADAPVMQEEIFGPVLPVLTYRTLSEAEAFVKARPKPLALYLFTKNRKTVCRVTGRLSYGGGCVNDTILHLASSRMGFGGVGESGMGSYHGKRSFDTFTHEKSIVEKPLRPDVPLRYPPYTKGKEKLLHRVLN